MPVTVVVGGQFGSEGKGKVAHYFAKTMGADVAVRVGGSNSGHTVIDEFGKARIFQHLPTASILDNIVCLLASGSYIDLDILFDEIASTNMTPDRLVIDPNAMIVTEDDIRNEKEGKLTDTIGSTASGTGKSVIRRINRNRETRLAKDINKLRPYVKAAVPFMRRVLKDGKRIIIEGTQGYGLSVLHSKFYPYTTSRDTTAAGFLAETGLSPLDVDEVVLVTRAFPIRVAGNSGPLKNEIDWNQITKISGSTEPIIEYTSVTKKIRRVAHFDPSVVLDAISVNNPTHIVLNHVDYVDFNCVNENRITEKALFYINNIESQIDKKIDYFGFGPASIISKNLSMHANIV